MSCDTKDHDDFILLLVIKGNLRHRIEKLGTEKDDRNPDPSQRLNPKQRELRQIAENQPWKDFKVPERPSWANGAFVYLTADHCKVVEKAIESCKTILQSKHLLVSPKYKSIVMAVLEASSEGPGREAFLMRRAGAIDAEDRIPCTPGDSPQPVDESGDDSRGFNSALMPLVSGKSSQSSRQTSDASEWSDTEFGRRRKNIRFLQLDGDLMNERHIDFELLEYLTSPPSVQRLEPEKWISAWEHVCKENDWIKMRDIPERRLEECPYCELCGKWAEMPHLLSDKCKLRRRRSGVQVGPLLKAILVAEEGAGSLGVVHAPGICPKPGCGLRAGGRSSLTHCCRRCEAAHRSGVSRLDRDPITDEAWKKPHGPECTAHADRKARAAWVRHPVMPQLPQLPEEPQPYYTDFGGSWANESTMAATPVVPYEHDSHFRLCPYGAPYGGGPHYMYDGGVTQ